MGLDEARRAFEERGLHPGDVSPDPVEQFGRWFAEVQEAGLPDAEAMVVATVEDGRPAARNVLLKAFDERGFVFYTNTRSPKARAMEATGRAALLFSWTEVRRQVRVNGRAERVDDREADAYFATRPRGSQLAAWASPQSEVLPSRTELDRRVEAERARWEGRDVERPPFWSGYRIVPETVELWQGRPDRLHDRVRYSRDGSGWRIERLAP